MYIYCIFDTDPPCRVLVDNSMSTTYFLTHSYIVANVYKYVIQTLLVGFISYYTVPEGQGNIHTVLEGFGS
jgi:hypothetical protein